MSDGAAEIQRSDVEFFSETHVCRAWLYRARDAGSVPDACIVMAHGIAGTRDASLEQYAEKFARAGFTVLVFDYRHFGDSDGEPRQLFSVPRQLQDWANAIAYARSLPHVDTQRIGLWGTSYSGGHVVVAAANDGRVRALSAQGAMMDMVAAFRNFLSYAGVANFLKGGGLGMLDLIRSSMDMPPVYVPVVAEPGELAVMSTPDALEGYLSIAPPDWRNEICARFALTSLWYRPVSYASQVPCPALIQVCLRDSVAPVASAVEAARRMGEKAELKQHDCGHFDIYLSERFEQASGEQLEFFERTLL